MINTMMPMTINSRMTFETSSEVMNAMSPEIFIYFSIAVGAKNLAVHYPELLMADHAFPPNGMLISHR